MARAVVTGAQGFIGRNLVDELRRRGMHVATIGRRPQWDGAHLTMESDRWKPEILAAFLTDWSPDVIFHLAGRVVGSAAELEAVNVDLAKSLQAALKLGTIRPTVVYAGSATEYGASIEDGVPISEALHCSPLTPYGLSKLRQTCNALEFSTNTNTPVLVARIFNPIGAFMPTHLALGAFARQLALSPRGHCVLHVGNIDVERDFIDVGLVAKILCDLASKPIARGIVNICSGEPTPLRTLVDKLIAASEKEVVIERDLERVRKGELKAIFGSTTRLAEWGVAPPQTDFPEVVKSIWLAAREPSVAPV